MLRSLVLIMAIIGIGVGGYLFLRNKSEAQSAGLPGTPIQAPPSPVGKCVNLGNALEAPNEGDWGYKIRNSDLQMIRELGFDTVRVPIKWSAHTDLRAPYKIDDRLFQRVDTVIQQALAAGLKVIIDVHHYDEMNESPQAHWPRLRAIWEQISLRYADMPDAVIFEFLNEPHTNIKVNDINAINDELLSLVRASNPDRWVIIGGVQWGALESLMKITPPNDPRVMTTFHYYEPFEFTHQGAPWAWKKVPLGQTWGTSDERRAVARDMANAARWRDQTGLPMLMGEFGVYVEVDPLQRAQWSEYVRKASELVGIGWCYWDWATALGMYDLESESLRPGMAPALLGQ
ncbi:MAG: glycoside hydrolase [Ponticaulis sp.]|nr:glycoside hydrolase [Ponticaulis sp.]